MAYQKGELHEWPTNTYGRKSAYQQAGIYTTGMLMVKELHAWYATGALSSLDSMDIANGLN